jgi:CHAD domain-containing protein
MNETLERELKLDPGRDFSVSDLPGEPLPARTFSSTYWDTDDLRLARAGVTLRRRVEGPAELWQLKLPRGASRLELELAGGPGEPPQALRDLVAGLARGRTLSPVATLETTRTGVLAADRGAPVAEVTLDEVSVTGPGGLASAFRELEAELVDGADERALARLGRRLRAAGAAAGDGRPKLLRVLGVDGAPPPQPPPQAPAAEHLQSAFRTQYERALAHDPGTRHGGDAEDLHQLRVATRRMRAFLRAAAPLLDPAWADGLRAELAWAGGALGPVRDLDVLLEHLRADAASLGADDERPLRRLFVRLEGEREAARAVLLEAMAGERWLALLDALEAAGEAPRVVADGSLAEIAAREFARLRKAVKALPADPPDDELHATRIRGKRARYAAELAEPAAGKAATRFIAAAKAFQDVVGEHQDAVVAEARLRALVALGGGSRAAFAAGRLVERQRARKAAARAAFPAAWRALDRAGRRAWT